MAEKDRNRHARLLCRIWDDDDWKALSPRAQWFYMLLASQPDITKAGVLGLTSKRWSRLASGPSVAEQIALAMAELERTRFIVVDTETEELLIRSYMRSAEVDKVPNVLKCAIRQARDVYSPKLRAELVVELRRLEVPIADAAADAMERLLPEPSPKGSGKGSLKGSANPSSKGSPNGGERERESSSSSVSSNSPSSKSAETRPEVSELCDRLLARIKANGVKATITKRWQDEARLLLDRDKRDLTEALSLIDWATSDSFWRSNILSMPTFRAKYDQLKLRSSTPVNGRHLAAVRASVEYQPPTPPPEIRDNPDPRVAIEWQREQRRAWEAKHA